MGSRFAAPTTRMPGVIGRYGPFEGLFAVTKTKPESQLAGGLTNAEHITGCYTTRQRRRAVIALNQNIRNAAAVVRTVVGVTARHRIQEDRKAQKRDSDYENDTRK